MREDADLVRRHVAALVQEAKAANVPADVLGRLLVREAVELWRSDRRWQDIADELRFTAESLDPDTDFEFMRP